MQVDSTSSTVNGNQMVVENDNENHETSENNENSDNGGQSSESLITKETNKLTQEDLCLLCDLFYLPFEHGGQGIQLLQEFNWLKSNAQIVMHKSQDEEPSSKSDVCKINFNFKILIRKIMFRIFLCPSILKNLTLET